MRKSFILAASLVFSSVVSASPLQWADLSKDVMFDQISAEGQYHKIFVPNYSNLEFKITPYDYRLFLDEETNTAGLEFTLRVNSETKTYIYTSDYKVNLLLGYVTIDAANQLVKFEKVYVKELGPLNAMNLRKNIDEYLTDKLLAPKVLQLMSKVELPISLLSLENMRQVSQHVTRLGEEDKLLLEYF